MHKIQFKRRQRVLVNAVVMWIELEDAERMYLVFWQTAFKFQESLLRRTIQSVEPKPATSATR
jgi:hypothetical protein